MKLYEKINDTLVDVDFVDKCYLLFDNAATGKTYLFKLIADIFFERKQTVCHIDYRFILPSDISEAELLLIDNYDVLDKEKIDHVICGFKNQIIVSAKTLNLPVSYTLYRIDYVPGCIKSVRLW